MAFFDIMPTWLANDWLAKDELNRKVIDSAYIPSTSNCLDSEGFLKAR